MKRRLIATAALSTLALLPLAGCPMTPPPPPSVADFGDYVRKRLTDNADAPPIDIADDDEFNTDDEVDDFGDVLTDPAFDAD